MKTISIGKCSRRNCETVLRHVEALIESRKLGTPHTTATAEWVAIAPEAVKEKLSAVGLLDYTPPNPLAKLGAFLDEYIRSRRKTLKVSSIIALEQCVRCLVKHFGADRPLTSIDHVAAEGFHEYLLTLSLSPVTVQKRISQARTFLTYARRCKLVTENAFEFIRAAGGDMTAKQEYVPEGIILQIIEAAPNAHW